jgi:hypothetical protein
MKIARPNAIAIGANSHDPRYFGSSSSACAFVIGIGSAFWIELVAFSLVSIESLSMIFPVTPFVDGGASISMKKAVVQ